MQKLYYNFNKTKMLFCAFLLLVYAIIVSLSGGNVLEMFIFVLASGAFVFLPGYLLYKSFRLENYIKGFAYPLIFTLGCAFFTITYIIFSLLNAWFLHYVLLIMLVVIFYKNIKKQNLLQNTFNIKNLALTPNYTFLFLLSTVLLFVYAFVGVVKYAHPNVVGEISLSQDFLWNVGNAQSFKLGIPPMDIRFDGVQLKYHYFGELLIAAFSVVTKISEYNLIAFYSQSLFLPTLVISLNLMGKYFYKQVFKANIFTALIFILSCLSLHKILPNARSVFYNNFIQSVLTNVNSMAIALIFLCVFAVLIANIKAKEYKVNLLYYFVLVLCFVLLVFSKSPIAAILAIAIFCTLIVMLAVKRKFIKCEIFIYLFLSALFLIIYILYFQQGANTSTGFNFYYSIELGYFGNILHRISVEYASLYPLAVFFLIIVQSFCMLPFTLPLFICSGIKALRNIKKQSAWHLICYACAIGGIVAFFSTYHEAFSNLYFFYLASFCTCFIAVDYFDFKKPNLKNIVFYALLLLSLITSMFLYINFLGSGLRQLLFNYNILPKYPYEFIVKSDDENAGIYLKSVMQPGDIFTTNRVHTGAGEGLSNVYTAFSGMQAYMEGFKYTVSNMGISSDYAMQRYNLNNALFSGELTHEQIVQKCEENAIKYIVYSTQFEGSVAQFDNLQKVYNSDTVYIYKLP